MAFGKRREESGSIEDEREALQLQRAALEDLKRQLVERVQAMQERERELEDAIAQARNGKPVAAPAAKDVGSERAALAARVAKVDERERALKAREEQLTAEDDDTAENALELERRARELDEREKALAEREAAQARDPDKEKLRRIESRLAELGHAEKLFLRTQSELAARSEAVAMRERLVAQRERELGDREDVADLGSRELSELEARLRRLEQQRADAETQGFSGGFRKLQQGRGSKPRS